MAARGKSCGPGYLAIGLVWALLIHGSVRVSAISEFQMENKCYDEISLLWSNTYQGRLTLSTEFSFKPPNITMCDTYIEAWGTLPKIVFYFEHLNLDCDDGFLQFFDDSEDTGYTAVSISGLPLRVCGSEKPSDVYTTNKERLRIRYNAKKSTEKKDVFKMIFTAFADDPCGSHFECSNGRCIHYTTECNGFNSCGDNSSCRMSIAAIVGIAIGSVAALAIIVSIVVCIYCSRRRKAQTGFQAPQPVQYSQTSNQHVYMPNSYNVPIHGQNNAGFSPGQTIIPGQNNAGVSLGQTPYYPSQGQGSYSAPQRQAT